jgi:hypothetical protein
VTADYNYWTEQAIEGISMMLKAGVTAREIRLILGSLASDIDYLISKARERENETVGN